MKVIIKEMNDGSAVIETLYGQQLSYFKTINEAKNAYFEWYRDNVDINELDEEFYLM